VAIAQRADTFSVELMMLFVNATLVNSAAVYGITADNAHH